MAHEHTSTVPAHKIRKLWDKTAELKNFNPQALMCTGRLGGIPIALACGGPQAHGRVHFDGLIIDFISPQTIRRMVASGHPMGLALASSPAAMMDRSLKENLIDLLPTTDTVAATLTAIEKDPHVPQLQFLRWLIMARSWVSTGSTGWPPDPSDQRIKQCAQRIAQDSHAPGSVIGNILYHGF